MNIGVSASSVSRVSTAPIDEGFSESPCEVRPIEEPTNSLHSAGPWKRFGFLLLNGWLIFHLFAIFVCPASVEPSSPLAQSGFKFVSPYLHALYLDHGYHYFAPDPGASTLVKYLLEFSDGSTQTGWIPERSIGPRLLYHRQFMLTEYLGNGPEEFQPVIERALARNLCRITGAIKVSLATVVHDTPPINEFQKGLMLNDETLFTEAPRRSYTLEELRLPMRIEVADPSLESRMSTEADRPVLLKESW